MTASFRTPTLADVISGAIDASNQDLHVALPGRVESYDASTKLANIQPLLLQRLTAEDGTVTTERLPVIPSVPVCFPRGGGGFFIEFPLQAGDNVLLVFCERSLDLWKTKGGEVDPIDSRFHTYQGAVCYPGLYAQPDANTQAPSGKLAIGKIGGTFADAARNGDACKTTLSAGPTGSMVALLGIIAANMTSAGGPITITNPSPGSLDITGTITAGSGSVQIS